MAVRADTSAFALSEPLAGHFAAFLAYLEAECGLAINTVRSYRGDLRDFLGWLTEHHGGQFDSVAEVDADRLRDYVQALRDRQLATSSLARRLSAIRTFYRFLVFDGVLTELMEIDEYDIEQVQHLNEVYEQARSKGINLGMRHAASSGGIFHVPEAYLDMVRPGISLYGCYPTDRSTKTRDIPLKSTFDFKTRVMYVKQLRAGDSLQYGRHYVAEKPIWIATLPVGHSDGWPRTTAGNCEVLIKGHRYPLVASLSANHCLVEIGDEPTVSMGDEVLLIGESGGETIEAHTVAEQSGVGVYTLTMHLNPWLPRRYVE